jgi:hypothetical protein
MVESELAPRQRRRPEPDLDADRRAERAPASREAPLPRERVVVVNTVRVVDPATPAVVPAQGPASPRIFPELAPDRPAAETEHDAELEPDVQVTIGRIEVRAVPGAPAAALEQARRPAVMTLEEYLRRRSGAAR